ncbi:hypothetical protein V9L05_21625 (plasmid) [Bernardetia sp. Wsw4-3y2]|uniref:hypothetical protein n=1 Tax=Bernardetia sp. Wsw4-3y2 TaxID=3127471 RepID=UPI0030D050C4
MATHSEKNRREKEELEKRILEQLKKQVFDKDEQLKSHQDDTSVREATKEALAEMTSLEKEDVEKIYQKIKRDELEKIAREQLSKKTKRNTFYLIVFALGLISISVAYYLFRPKPVEPVLFSYTEDFETESSIFVNEESYNYKKNIENGEFIYESNIDEWCYWNSSPVIKFPENYTITTKSNWKSGSYAMYGINLINNNENYMIFSLSKEGKANVSVRYYDKFTDNDWNYKVFTDKSNAHIQRIEVKAGNYEYYIDDKFIRKGKLAPFQFNYIGFRLCDHQTIGFEEISIKNDDTGEYILIESFENPTTTTFSDWDVDSKFSYTFENKEGKFIMNHNEEEFCHRTEAFLPTVRQDKKWELSTDVTWKEGQPKDFGVLFISGNGEIGEFMITNAGKAVFKLVGQDNKVTYATKYVPTGFVSKGKETYRLSIKSLGNKQLEFFVNDKKVLKEEMLFSKIEKIGLITCGTQIVEFDNVKYEEK